MSEQVPQSEDDAFELDCLFNWMRFLAGPSRQYAQGEVVVRAYGELDESFIVIEKQISHAPWAIDQYVVGTMDAANSLMSLVRLLKEFQFDLGRLVARLEKLPYGIEGRARLEHVQVNYRVHGESPTAGDDEIAPAQEQFVEAAFNDDDPDATLPGRSMADIASRLAPVDGRHGRPTPPASE